MDWNSPGLADRYGDEVLAVALNLGAGAANSVSGLDEASVRAIEALWRSVMSIITSGRSELGKNCFCTGPTMAPIDSSSRPTSRAATGPTGTGVVALAAAQAVGGH